MTKSGIVLLLLVLICIISSSIISSNKLSYDLSEFPDFIEKSNFDTLVVIGDHADVNDITAGANIISSYDDCSYLDFNLSTRVIEPQSVYAKPAAFSRCRLSTTILASDIKNISAQNIISVGGPCANKVTAEIMDIPTTGPECATGFESGKGLIKLYHKWNKTQLVVFGYDVEDTKNAAQFLVEKKNLRGTEIIISKQTRDSDYNLTRYNKWYKVNNNITNFNHPYVKWLIDGKGNGSFVLNLIMRYNTAKDLAEEELSKFGSLDSFRCYDSQNICTAYLDITDFDMIQYLFSVSFIEDIHMERIVSDYKLNISIEEMKNCEVDADCQKVSTDCCSGANCNFESVNKKYVDLWNSQIYCLGYGCVATICMKSFYPLCTEGQCSLIEMGNCDRKEECVSSQKFGCVSKKFCDRVEKCYEDGEWNCEYCSYGLCSDNPP
jgi:hypothetical protein